MKPFILCLLIPFASHSQATSSDGRPGWFEEIVPSLSADYHYQGFHGTELALHLTHYNNLSDVHHEYGLFLGTDVNYSSGFHTFAPAFGLETDWLFRKLKGWGISSKLRGTIWYRDQNAYASFGPEVAITWLTIFEFFYAYNQLEKMTPEWQPHRFGVRLTLGYERTIINAFSIHDKI